MFSSIIFRNQNQILKYNSQIFIIYTNNTVDIGNKKMYNYIIKNVFAKGYPHAKQS
jgi:hypothetical protein